MYKQTFPLKYAILRRRKWAKTWMGSSCLYHEKYIDTCKIGKQNIHRIKLERKTEKIHF